MIYHLRFQSYDAAHHSSTILYIIMSYTFPRFRTIDYRHVLALHDYTHMEFFLLLNSVIFFPAKNSIHQISNFIVEQAGGWKYLECCFFSKYILLPFPSKVNQLGVFILQRFLLIQSALSQTSSTFHLFVHLLSIFILKYFTQILTLCITHLPSTHIHSTSKYDIVHNLSNCSSVILFSFGMDPYN